MKNVKIIRWSAPKKGDKVKYIGQQAVGLIAPGKKYTVEHVDVFRLKISVQGLHGYINALDFEVIEHGN